MKNPSWLDIAFNERGVKSFPAGTSNPRIEEYHRSISNCKWSDKIPWCSSFLHWSMSEAGLDGTGSALARSWLYWGGPIDQPRHGCVVVLWREQPDSPKGHVGLFLEQDSKHVHLWGGNQLDEVREHFYPNNMVLGYRWPTDCHLP
ncbi:MAG TPA: TIGR02594 family protein [Lacunisphaera sp.]|jgi:uncharacterized protein (TIGR02594 family)